MKETAPTNPVSLVTEKSFDTDNSKTNLKTDNNNESDNNDKVCHVEQSPKEINETVVHENGNMEVSESVTVSPKDESEDVSPPDDIERIILGVESDVTDNRCEKIKEIAAVTDNDGCTEKKADATEVEADETTLSEEQEQGK